MRRYKMLVFGEPFEGQDEQFNDWANNSHLSHVCALPGFTVAQRFALHSVQMGTTLNRYLAIYDIETDDIDGSLAAYWEAPKTDAMPLHPSFNVDATTIMLFEEASPKVSAE